MNSETNNTLSKGNTKPQQRGLLLSTLKNTHQHESTQTYLPPSFFNRLVVSLRPFLTEAGTSMIEFRAAHITLYKPLSDEAKQDSKSGGKEDNAGTEYKVAKVKGSEKDKAAGESTKPGTESSSEEAPVNPKEQIPHTYIYI